MEALEVAVLQLADNKKEAGYLLYSAHMAALLSFPVIFFLVPMLRIPIMISFFPLFMYHLINLAHQLVETILNRSNV